MKVKEKTVCFDIYIFCFICFFYFLGCFNIAGLGTLKRSCAVSCMQA